MKIGRVIALYCETQASEWLRKKKKKKTELLVVSWIPKQKNYKLEKGICRQVQDLHASFG